MSDIPPPIPQKTKYKGLHMNEHIISQDYTSKSRLNQEKPLEEVLFYHNENESNTLDSLKVSFAKMNVLCQQLQFQDQKLMRIFLFIREEIQLLNETDVNKSPVSQSKVSNFSLATIVKEEAKNSNYMQKIEDLILNYTEKDKSENPNNKATLLDIFSHFDIPYLSEVTDEFRCRYALTTNSIHNCENNLMCPIACVEKFTPPPVPQKRGKGYIVCNSNSLNGQDNVTNESSNDQSLVFDPVLNQKWPRSKSFNSNAFLSNHNRQSSMTLSDFYDHLNPIPDIGIKRTSDTKDNFEESLKIDPDTEHSHDQSSIIHNPLTMLPISKSSYDCKTSSLESFDNKDNTLSDSYQYRKLITRSIYDSVERQNKFSSSLIIDSNDGKLHRADSTPSLFPRSVLSNSIMNNNHGNSVNNSKSDTHREDFITYAHDKSPNQYSKSKSSKKLFSILSRGLSSGLNRNNERKTTKEKYITQSSDSLFRKGNSSIDLQYLHKNELLLSNASQKNSRTMSSILCPVIEHPPPIPAKSHKSNDSTKIDLQQTWC